MFISLGIYNSNSKWLQNHLAFFYWIRIDYEFFDFDQNLKWKSNEDNSIHAEC